MVMEIVERPSMPAGYGIKREADGQLPWSWVEEQLVAARSYWVCTTRADEQLRSARF